MIPKSLSEVGWKAIVTKNDVKDNGLQKALAAYEDLNDDEHDERLKAIASVSQLANALKRVKDVTALPDVAKYLASVVGAADSEKADIAKAKAQADKLQAEAKKREAQEKDQDQEAAEDEEEQGDYATKLAAAFQKLKGAKGLSWQFIVCDAKPHCALMLAKKIGPQHKAELTKITDGSKRFLHLGTCQFQDGKFVFSMEKPVSGLARKLQDSVKNFIGKKLPLKVGDESAEGEEAPADQAQKPAAPSSDKHSLEKAPDTWRQARQDTVNTIEQLKAAVRKAFAGEPDIISRLEQNLQKLDDVIEPLDYELAAALAKAHATNDPAARKAELQRAKTILANCLVQVKKAEPLIAKIDSNPFGVKTNLKQMFADKMKHMAQAIGV